MNRNQPGRYVQENYKLVRLGLPGTKPHHAGKAFKSMAKITERKTACIAYAVCTQNFSATRSGNWRCPNVEHEVSRKGHL